ncbi:hypothetical protein B0J17DRAFT_443403 [Rhizoctonia solani]|nr:hypothetical protein B0J17DRAFT_443403 [Rhizoctonia solani]
MSVNLDYTWLRTDGDRHYFQNDDSKIESVLVDFVTPNDRKVGAWIQTHALLSIVEWWRDTAHVKLRRACTLTLPLGTCPYLNKQSYQLLVQSIDGGDGETRSYDTGFEILNQGRWWGFVVRNIDMSCTPPCTIDYRSAGHTRGLIDNEKREIVNSDPPQAMIKLQVPDPLAYSTRMGRRLMIEPTRILSDSMGASIQPQYSSRADLETRMKSIRLFAGP